MSTVEEDIARFEEVVASQGAASGLDAEMNNSQAQDPALVQEQDGEQDPMALAKLVLLEVWGFEGFRGIQEQVIKRLLVDEESALCLMPTGGGKSLCYQIPAICLPGLTLVVSPLIALMKDQVDALRALNVPAASMDSSLSQEEMASVKRQLKEGTLKILYVAPERLNNENFVLLMADQEVSLLAVDESHCVSEWGPSFRPDYLKVARFAKEVDAKRVLCLTATATPSVARDICTGFDICPDSGVFSSGSFRFNLSLRIQPTTTDENKLMHLVPFLKSRIGGAAIVYCTTHAESEKIVLALAAQGVVSKAYHAGLPAATRKAIQDEFMAGELVVVATIAFGMGIDKSNIRQVAHFTMPKTLFGELLSGDRQGWKGRPPFGVLDAALAFGHASLGSFARSNTPSSESIKGWLMEVFAGTPAPDGSLDFDLLQQSNKWDIGRNTLGLLYAQLELQNGLLRATTPFYANYTLSPSPRNPGKSWKSITSDPSAEAVAIRKHWKSTSTGWAVNLMEAGKAEEIDRKELARQITRWEGADHCAAKVSGVRNRYMPLKKLPTPKAKVTTEKLALKLFNQLVDREEADVKRLHSVATFISAPECFAYGLAKYFGDADSVPNGACGQCTFCSTQAPLSFGSNSSLPIDDTKIAAALAVCGVRDDPRFLARLCFGISSPRITSLGLGRHPVMGCLAGRDLQHLHAAQECPLGTVSSSAPSTVAQILGPSCHCGQPSVQRTVAKEGETKGRKFFVCSKGPAVGNSQGAGAASSSAPPAPAPVAGPPCSCGQPSVQRTVAKEGETKGRKFFVCSKGPTAGKCKYFEWADGKSGATKGSAAAKPSGECFNCYSKSYGGGGYKRGRFG
ncbi:hypothetical protein RQP46_000932 [Phenoliferia psychrophenolica]